MSCNKVKGPSEVLDYEEDWTSVLAAVSPADTILTSSWTADNGVVVDDDTGKTATTTTVLLSGGRLWSYANVVNTITTASRTHVRKMVLEIRPR